MIKFKYWTLKNKAFMAGLNKLIQFTGYPSADFAMDVGEKITVIDKAMKKAALLAQPIENDIVLKHAKFDENKKPVVNEQGKIVIEEAQNQAFAKDVEELEEREYEVNIFKLNLKDFDKVGLSPLELVMLRGLFFNHKEDQDEESNEEKS